MSGEAQRYAEEREDDSQYLASGEWERDIRADERAKFEPLLGGLRKVVKDDATEWIDANIIRLLLDRYDHPHTEDDALSVTNQPEEKDAQT